MANKSASPNHGKERTFSRWQKKPRRWPGYLYSIGLVMLATALGYPIHLIIEPTNLVMLYLAVVVIAAVTLGRGPSLLASVLSLLAFDFFFINPRFTFSVSDTQYLLTFGGLFGVSLVISSLTGMVRNQVEEARHREAQSGALYALSRDLAGANNLEDILHIALQHTSQMVNGQAGIFLVKDGTLELRAASPGFAPSNAEIAAARWTSEHHQPASRDSNTHFETPTRHLPLTILNEVIGILSVAPSNNQHLTSDQRQVIETSASLIALAIERIRLTEQANQAQVLRATEKLMTALFNSLSHDLRTPLASVTGVLSSLRDDEKRSSEKQILDQGTRHILLETAWEESQRLNRLVGNLLDMTRLEAGAVRLSRAPCDIQDVIGSAIAQLAERLVEHPVRAKIHSDLPLVSADFVLLTQVLVNLFDNSVKYSPSGTTIQVNAHQQGDYILIQVSNAGPDIPASDLERVFDKFYRVEKPDQVSGTGLGLAICKGIVEVHGGRIWADNRPEGGPIFSILLPVNPPEGEETA
jgi:two-component system sensor histidine kinase KdpD